MGAISPNLGRGHGPLLQVEFLGSILFLEVSYAFLRVIKAYLIVIAAQPHTLEYQLLFFGQLLRPRFIDFGHFGYFDVATLKSRDLIPESLDFCFKAPDLLAQAADVSLNLSNLVVIYLSMDRQRQQQNT
jgi:hypothetical protein